MPKKIVTGSKSPLLPPVIEKGPKKKKVTFRANETVHATKKAKTEVAVPVQQNVKLIMGGTDDDGIRRLHIQSHRGTMTIQLTAHQLGKLLMSMNVDVKASIRKD
jgi:hypothetical protein